MSEYGAWGSESASTAAAKSDDPLQSVRLQMEALTKEIADYSFKISSLGGAQDNAGVRSEIKQKRTMLMTKCQAIKNELQHARSQADRVQFDRLTSQFHDQVKRVESLSDDANTQISLNPIAAQTDERTPLNYQNEQQQQMNQQIDLDLTAQRKKDLLSVERDMTGLRDAFVDLNNLVQEQGEDIIKIEDATLSAVDRTDDAVGELSKARVNQSKARKKCIILLVLLLIVIVIIVLIILFETKPWECKSNCNPNQPNSPTPQPTP